MFLTFAFLTDHFVFGKRCDKNPNLKYFSAEDFNLSAEPISLPKGLKGFIYRKEDKQQKDKLIIFCHGIGPGHIAYTTEIAYFCNQGYPVLAVDSRGCNFSDGKNIKGMYEGVKTVISAIDFAKGKGYKDIFLVGHSWGAYSALCASAKRKVDKVVAISAPNTPSKTMQEGAAPIISRPLAAVLRPFWWIVNLLKYGANGNSNAAKCAQKNGTRTLLIHGDKDRVVTPNKAVFYKADGKHITKLLAEGKAHNPYNTENAEKLLAELSAKFKRRDIADITEFDFKGATEEDKEVLQKI
ncbi:MAG: alpha/beta fold hydrolase, partial [Clostridia bacterium]|nr:alpha/beta fold hydrolase [Clostridia bacterium]